MVELEDIGFLEGIEAFERNTALKTRLDLADVVLEAAQALAFRLGNRLAGTQHADLVGPVEGAIEDHAAGDIAAAADFKDLADLGMAVDHVLEDGREHPLDRLFHV